MSNKPSVLIADDDEQIRKLLEVILSSTGCEINSLASDGGEAVARFKKINPTSFFLISK
jgi:CheY-like chemotaxis protein